MASENVAARSRRAGPVRDCWNDFAEDDIRLVLQRIEFLNRGQRARLAYQLQQTVKLADALGVFVGAEIAGDAGCGIDVCIAIIFIMSPWTLILPPMNACIAGRLVLVDEDLARGVVVGGDGEVGASSSPRSITTSPDDVSRKP